MANRRFEMHEYRQVIARFRQGESIRQIAKSGLMGRHKASSVIDVARKQGWLELNTPVPDEATLASFFEVQLSDNQRLSCLVKHKAKIVEWVKQGISATVIYASLQRNYGFAGSYSTVRRFVSTIKKKQPKATMILTFNPGEAAQVDFGSGPQITDFHTGEVRKSWIFVMTLCFSRHQYAEVVFDQKVMTWVGCHQRAFEFFQGVPEKIIIDNLKSAITKACYYDPAVQRSYSDLALSYGFKIAPCPVADPQKKGIVESGVKYVKNNFFPLREFRDLADANQQVRQWVLETAGNRIHGTTKRRPLDLFAELDSDALSTLPDNPIKICAWHKAKVHGDCHVQYEKCRYSVPYRYIRNTVWIKETEKTLSIYESHNLLATHPKKTGAGMVSTITDHYPPEAQAYLMQDPQWCLKQAEKIGPNCLEVIETLFENKILEKLRAAQGIIRLKQKYGPKRLETACGRALQFQSVSYRNIKQILNNGTDQDKALLTEQNDLDPVYTGNSRFSNPIQPVLH